MSVAPPVPAAPIVGPSRSTAETPDEVRRRIHAENRVRSIRSGFASFLGAGSAWLATTVLLAVLPWWAQIPLAVVSGLLIAVLFVVGHDAAHGALFPRRGLNRLAGRLSLLPALHPLSSWVHSHNRLHHAFTNIREKDSSFPPLDLAEYRALGGWQRWLTRSYRTWYGLGLYYFVEVWWKWEMAPSEERRPKNPRAFRGDRLLVLAFAALWLAGLVAATDGSPSAIAWNLAVGFVLPQFVWNWFIGFIIFQQHTYPRVPWFSERDLPAPSFFQMQVQSTPYLYFPKTVRWVMRQIMEHAAHHTDPMIPLYHLPEAQQEICRSYRKEMIRVIWTPRLFLNTLRTCRLYDYERHHWMDYDGTPTTETLYHRTSAACEMCRGAGVGCREHHHGIGAVIEAQGAGIIGNGT